MCWILAKELMNYHWKKINLWNRQSQIHPITKRTIKKIIDIYAMFIGEESFATESTIEMEWILGKNKASKHFLTKKQLLENCLLFLHKFDYPVDKLSNMEHRIKKIIVSLTPELQHDLSPKIFFSLFKPIEEMKHQKLTKLKDILLMVGSISSPIITLLIYKF